MNRSEPDQIGRLDWAALLGKWMEFARAAVALPAGAEGKRWRGSIVHIIALQAVTHALAEVGLLDAADRAVALDRAEILIEKHAGALGEVWKASPPAEVVALIDDARRALGAAATQGD